MKTLVFTFIDASPLSPFQNIYSVECREWSDVKEITLSERSELGIFSHGANEVKAVGSLPTAKPF